MEARNSSIVEIFGINLKSLRKDNLFTQEELAERTGLTVKYISHLERGLSFPSADTLDRIALALSVPVYRLFFPVGEKNAIPRDVLKKELHKMIDEIK